MPVVDLRIPEGISRHGSEESEKNTTYLQMPLRPFKPGCHGNLGAVGRNVERMVNV